VAIILRGKTQCSICGIVIQEQEPIVSTSHFIGEQGDPLWRFSDSAMHKSCFLDWPLRERFIARFNASTGTTTFGDGTYHHMENDGHISIFKREAPKPSARIIATLSPHYHAGQSLDSLDSRVPKFTLYSIGATLTK
jgi:hypothetical protein